MSMRPPKLRASEFVNQFVAILNTTEENMKFAGLPRGTLRGTIVDVNDPLERGRVKVIFDDHNINIPSRTGTSGDFSSQRPGQQADPSHWIDTSPAFKGKQPEGLKGKRVNIVPSSGEYQYSILQDVLYDPDLLADSAKKSLEMPNNSTMVRFPIYPSGSLPPASAENHGCAVIEEGGPMSSDWVCVCLKRQGKYIWVRHVDLAHGHAGENDGTQTPDSSGDIEQPVKEQSVWDYVFPTSAQTMPKSSKYGTTPRSNPYGGQATWHEPPQ
jgi:hypothetical protein